MISNVLVTLARCPDCNGRIARRGNQFACEACGRIVGHEGDAFLDLRPAAAFVEQTKYLDAALHADARHQSVSPPLLSARVRNDMLRRLLQPSAGEPIVDLGCGSGRVLVWNADLGAHAVGIDVSPFFARDALEQVDLALGDLRRLPFADGSFAKAYALDVLEHLSREALGRVLGEAARVLKPGGSLFVYSHVRKNAPIAVGLKAINRAARALERAGLVDLRQERLRKSDHRNPLADHADLAATVAAAGFRIAKIRYYTPLIGGVFENIVLRVGERFMARRASRKVGRVVRRGEPEGVTGEPPVARPDLAAPECGHNASDTDFATADDAALKAARLEAKRRIAARGPLYAALRAATWLMKLDIWLFGRIRSGPFFALLVKSR